MKEEELNPEATLAILEAAARTNRATQEILQRASMKEASGKAEELQEAIGEKIIETCPKACPGPWLVWVYKGKSLLIGEAKPLVGVEKIQETKQAEKAKRFTDFREAVQASLRQSAMAGTEPGKDSFIIDERMKKIWPR